MTQPVGAGNETWFAFHVDSELVAYAGIVDGLDDAVVATEEVRLDPHVYVPGLHVAQIATNLSSQWFASWRSSGGKRDLMIHDAVHERTILVVGAFIAASSDGTWYDLVIDAAVVQGKQA